MIRKNRENTKKILFEQMIHCHNINLKNTIKFILFTFDLSCKICERLKK